MNEIEAIINEFSELCKVMCDEELTGELTLEETMEYFSVLNGMAGSISAYNNFVKRTVANHAASALKSSSFFFKL